MPRAKRPAETNEPVITPEGVILEELRRLDPKTPRVTAAKALHQMRRAGETAVQMGPGPPQTEADVVHHLALQLEQAGVEVGGQAWEVAFGTPRSALA